MGSGRDVGNGLLKKVRVAFVCRDNETVADLLQRLDASLGKVLAENTIRIAAL